MSAKSKEPRAGAATVCHWLAIASIATGLVWAGGCVRVTYTTPRPLADESIDIGAHYFAFGLAGDPTIDLSEPCPGGFSRIEVEHTAADIVISTVTLGIYTPTTVRVWCDGGSGGGSR